MSTPTAPADWEHRELCSDGACTGVIGADGACKVCGRAAPGGAPRPGAGPTDADDDGDDDADDADDAGDDLAADGDEDDADGEDEDEDEDDGGDLAERALCPDGACIGVIGDDGRCKVCGREAA